MDWAIREAIFCITDRAIARLIKPLLMAEVYI